MKNLLLLGLMTLAALSYAKEPVEHESLEEAEGYKIEAAVKEKKAERAFAGAKAKKENAEEQNSEDEITTSEDSELRYWRYSE